MWLTTNWGFGTHIYDPNGPLYKQVASAGLGPLIGVVAMLVGLALVVASLVRRRKVLRHATAS